MPLLIWLVLLLSFIEGETKKNETCFDDFGCFNMDYPWSHHARPMKPPRNPKRYPIQAILFKRPEGNDTHRFSLYPKVNLTHVPYDPKLNSTVVIVPGYMQPLQGGWAYKLKNAFLQKVDANVIVVNTTSIVQFDFYQFGSDMRVVAVMIGNMLEAFKNKGADYKTMHLIGMDISAHMVGYVGKAINKLGRITGLDPQQVLFEKLDPQVRIDKGDAIFVDVIHSDARSVVPEIGVGMIEPVGHVDIYLNGGSTQPGCTLPGSITITKRQSIYDFIRKLTEQWASSIVCNHVRSEIVFRESILNDNCIFVAHKATYDAFFQGISNAEITGVINKYTTITTNCTRKTCTAIGLYTPLFPFRGAAVTTTRSQSPYCQDEAPNDKIKQEYGANIRKWYESVVGERGNDVDL